MSQTTETPQPTNAELVAQVVGAVTAVQDAEAVLVEGAKNLADHIADPNAHGRDVAACIAQAVADHDGNEGAHNGTFVKAGDARLTDARAPNGHKATHQTGGSDALAPDDIGAAPASHTGVAATASVLGHVKFGTAAGTACQGNDSRLANARTPTVHASTATTYGAASDTQYGHAKASGTTPKASGTAAVGTETGTFARGDHVHPAQTTVSGNAGTATKLATARTVRTNLASTSTASFDGSANITPGVTGVLPVANGGTGNTTNTAADSTKWNGAAKTVSTGNPSGGANGDIWFKY